MLNLPFVSMKSTMPKISMTNDEMLLLRMVMAGYLMRLIGTSQSRLLGCVMQVVLIVLQIRSMVRLSHFGSEL